MKKLHYLIAIAMTALCGLYGNAQTTIVAQSFEGLASDNWDYTLSPPDGTFNSSDDYWRVAAVSGFSTIPSDGTMAVEGQDLQNGDNPNTDSAEIIFVSQDISSFTSVDITFDYELDGFDNGDALFYTLTLDGVPQAEVEIGATMSGRSEEVSFIIDVPDSANNIALTVRVKQNGTDQIGLDNFKLIGTSAAAAATAPIITFNSASPAGDVQFNQAVTANYTITDSNNNISTATLNWSFTPDDMASTPSSSSVVLNNITGDTYEGTIPGQTEAGVMEFQVTAVDDDTTPESTTSAMLSYKVLAPETNLSIVINEMSQGTGGTQEWVELLVVEDNLDLRGYELGDNDDGNFQLFVTFSQDASWAAVEAGTLIVIYNASQPDDVIIPDSNFSDLAVTIASDDTTYFSGTWQAYSNSDDDDAPAIRNATGIIIHDMAVTHTSATIDTPDSGESKSYIAEDALPSSLSDTNNWITLSAEEGTPGMGNSADNFNFISTLRGRTTYVYTGGSWSPSDPIGLSNATEVLIIKDGTAVISGDLDGFDLYIGNGSTLDTGSVNVNLTGDLFNIGSFSTSDTSLNFGGVRSQSINGNSIEVANLFLNNSLGLELNAMVSIEGSLGLTNGLLNTKDNLTFKSTNGKSAIFGSGQWFNTGNVTVEQFYPAQRAFRFVSSPVTMDGTIFSNWQQNGLNPGDMGYVAGDGTHITGGTVSNGFDQNVSNNPSAFIFNNQTGNWGPVTSTNDPVENSLAAGDAIRLFVRGDRSIDLTTNDAPIATKLITTGTLEIGDVLVTDINATDGGFSLVGNPYQAQVNLETLFADATATNDLNTNRYYAWDPTINPNGGYVLYDFSTGSTVLGSEVNQFLQPNQSFFLTTSDDAVGTLDPTLTFRESFKSASSMTTAVYSANSNQDLLRVHLMAASEVAAGRARDGIVLKFNDLANNGIDSNDAVKIFNPNENLSIHQDPSHLTISEMQNPVDGQEILFSLTGLLESSYTLRIDNSYNGLHNVYLNDTFLNTNTLLSSGVNMISKDFDPSNASSVDPARFRLVFSTQTLGLDNLNVYLPSVYPNPLGDEDLIIGNLKAQESLTVEVYNSTGQMLNSYKKQPTSTTDSLKGLSVLKKGLYFVTLKQGDTITTVKLLKK